MLSPDPFLVPWQNLEEANQALDIGDLILKWSTTDAQNKLCLEYLGVGCLVRFRIPDHNKN